MMYWGYYDGWSWLLMAAMMVLFWGGAAALIVFVARVIVGPKGGDQIGQRSGDQAMGVLRRRLASGEITQEEFEKTRRVLQG